MSLFTTSKGTLDERGSTWLSSARPGVVSYHLSTVSPFSSTFGKRNLILLCRPTTLACKACSTSAMSR